MFHPSWLMITVAISIGACGGSGTPGDSTPLAVATTNTSCTTTQMNSAGFDLGNVVASGTASGPTGSSFTFDISNAGQGGASAISINCGGWTQNGNTPNNVSCVAVAGVPSINWTVTQQVYWCTSQCNSSPATNNADLTMKYTTAAIVDASNANQHTSAVTVSCP